MAERRRQHGGGTGGSFAVVASTAAATGATRRDRRALGSLKRNGALNAVNASSGRKRKRGDPQPHARDAPAGASRHARAKMLQTTQKHGGVQASRNGHSDGYAAAHGYPPRGRRAPRHGNFAAADMASRKRTATPIASPVAKAVFALRVGGARGHPSAKKKRRREHVGARRGVARSGSVAASGFPRGKRATAAASTPSACNAPARAVLDLSLGLEADIVAFARFVALSHEERAFRSRVFGELAQLIGVVFPGAKVELYGSSSSGLETFRSDLDISVGNLDLDAADLAPLAQRIATACAADDAESIEQNEEHEEEDDDDDGELVVDAVDEEQDTAHVYCAHNSSDDTGEATDEEPTFSLNLSIPGGATNNVRGLGGSPTGSRRAPPRAMVAASTSTKSPWNPTLRRHKIRQLRALQQLLMVHRPQFKVKCLNKARIPILMIVDQASGLHIDLGVNREVFHSSDHGRTTALVTELQSALGPPFIAIVAFLKEFLHQFDLDKPFTGGLGSYRLYMMVAYVFTVRLARGKPPSAAKALLTFLELFGNRATSGFLNATTTLPVRHGAQMDVVEFSAVFRLDECIDKFAMAFDIISKHRTLGCVVYEEKLTQERHECTKRIRKAVQKHEQQQQPQDSGAASSDSDRETTEHSRASDSEQEEESDDDDRHYR